ncbi:MFS transporter [Ktedonosporobacter rubrisoli]|uniref:MFS transporter n=1 Tax=Ktedonosporobacter rubrisoli TaxID=2509675 RepID=A0A4P6JN25_KTERU|nr:MFS transporter [Ktedonosporobacter rubrisoli]QBD76442.1 MFS transporter [Ktedonosporobacter rubrisoli]
MSVWQIVLILLGVLLNGLNSSMIAVALVPIGEYYHVSTWATAWLVSGLYLATSVAQPIMGRLADLLGAKRIFCAGLVVVAIAGLGANVAPQIGWLVAARVLLGIGTSAAYPAALAMVRRHSASNSKGGISSSTILGALTIAGQVCTALGPSLGGFLISLHGWQTIFLVNIPLAGFCLIGTIFSLPGDDRSTMSSSITIMKTLDIAGMVLFSAMIIMLLLVLMNLQFGISWLPLGIACASGALLVWRELHCASPFIDLRMLAANKGQAMTYLRYALTYLVFYSIFYGFSQWLEQGRGLDPVQAGLVMLPIAMVGALCAAMVTRMRRVWLMLIAGTSLMLISTSSMQLFYASIPVLALVAIAAIMGIPNGFNNLGNQNALYMQAPAEQMGAAAGLLRTSQYIGAILAASLITLSFTPRATDTGLHHLSLVLIVVSVVLLIITLSDKGLRSLVLGQSDKNKETTVNAIGLERGEKQHVTN